ncbi:SARP family transcriptional regulator [Pseudonocardia sulfidoxydans NBRC 16205]|uniref:SARP family transcriptional regulator n=1 Tax=Pseudonocardia sulfidoxydans NBRC 16205 TaxID=1223511 RepID=A0A511DFF8_9PSEU|nr:BTAD domain-containing putative transcriptional regulator [Pseudonocardia sulfidoxydans]GEL23520.1 SARP family transcriptional regulator [Pseudonocardia sulfidoxydans NBRC 16205]
MRIGVLGSVAAWPSANGTVAPADTDAAPPGLRLRGLLARLALDAGRPVTTEALVDDLWGEEPPDAVANALQSLVSRLRRALGARLVVTVQGGYLLDLAPDAVDAGRFGHLVATARAGTDAAVAASALEEALGLWRGPALADVRRLPFADAVAARLEEQRAVAVETRAALGLVAGDPGAGLDAVSDLLAAQPLRESAAVVLARGLHATGRQADALAVLDRTRERLAGELGVDPGPELARARLDVLRGTPAPAPARKEPVHRSVALTSFVGRDADVGRVRSLLSTARLVTLLGPGGAGKTRLAREIVDGRAEAPVAELAPLTGAEQLPGTVLAAVGEPELMMRNPDDGPPDLTGRLLTALGDRDVVLVLDNCEHLVDDVAVLTQRMLEAAPRLRVLATSREPLAVPGEVLHPVEPLDTAAAVRLFADRAAAVAPGFVVDTTTQPVVAEICARLDGQPLPLELAAARLRTLSLTEIAARLDDRFRLLTSGARTALPRHQTLRAVVDWSWDLLVEPERILLRRMGVFAGGATAATVERVCAGAGGPDPADAFDLLAALVDKSLVVAVPSGGPDPTRYRLLETIRDYAAERLAEAGEADAVVAAHAAWVVDLAETSEPHLRGADQLRWLVPLRAENDNIAVALRRAVNRGDGATAHRIVAAMGWSWFIRGRYEESITWVAEAVALPPPDLPAVAARTLAYLLLTFVARGDVDAAVARLDEAVTAAAATPEPRHPALQLVAPLGRAFTGDPTLLEEVSVTSDDPWVRAFATQVRAQLAENDGDIELQRRLVRTAHELFTTTGDRFGLGMTIGTLGELEDLAGNLDAAAAAYDEALALATELGNDDDLPQFMLQQAGLCLRRGDPVRARELAESAADIASGPFGVQTMARAALADIERVAGNLTAARRHLAAAERDAGHGLAREQRRALVEIVRYRVEVAAGDVDAAAASLDRALDEAIASHDGPVAALVVEYGAQFALTRGDADAAGLMLGVALAQRGTLDHGNPDVVAVVDGVRDALGPAAADDALRRGRGLPRPDGLAAVRDLVRTVSSRTDQARLR